MAFVLLATLGVISVISYQLSVALLHESSVLNIHSAVISLCDCNDYYWTIVIALVMSDRSVW
ncbi:MAG: hypothetical protein SWX82_08555 [Cyanobacteriota bacterium]|nr:hypothetical protein [Cyanobacteriota bacterium]